MQQKGYNNTVSANKNDEAEKYQFQEQELEEELGKNTYAYQWRDYDPAIGRFGKVDRFSEKYLSHSPYAFTVNNPIRFIEVKGDSIIGVNQESAGRAIDVARNSFSGDSAKKIRDLFQLNSDGLSFKSISEESLLDAISETGLSTSQQALAIAYFGAINSNNSHKIELVFRSEGLSSETQVASSYEFSTGQDIETAGGGGINLSYPNGNSISVIVMDSQTPITDFVSGGQTGFTDIESVPGELLAHELLGHALGNARGSRTSGFEDAIQMSNIYWNAQGVGGQYRTGQEHQGSGGRPLSKEVSNGIPKHLGFTVLGDRR